jgi:uncharacterized membrane protein
MDDQFLMIALRLVHIVLGVFWVGAVFALAWFVGPSTSVLGESAGKFMEEMMMRRKLSPYIGVAMILTVLSGLTMYIHYAMRSDGDFTSSHMGMVLGIGAVAGIVAGGIGGTIAGGSARKMLALGKHIKESGAPPSDADKAQMAALAARQAWALRTSAWLLVIAVVAMAVARYT